jgi:hypothetical protein
VPNDLCGTARRAEASTQQAPNSRGDPRED